MRPLVGADTILSGTIYLSVDSIPLSSRNGLFSFPATTDCPKKSALKACNLVAWSSENVEKEAYYYAIEGKLTEFAILLMVARKEVLVPITFSIQDGDEIMALQQSFQKKLVSISDEWLKSPGTLGRKKATWILKSNVVLRSAALVLEVVERAGNSLEDYLMFEQHSQGRRMVEIVADENYMPWHGGKEPVDHLFFECQFSSLVWGQILRKCVCVCGSLR
ncbi:hypothetical protein RHMOL_Rhmol10G0151000 [Rhododendron molle]|uniref:Uncharacterized protein n=1 Tax=Rhododendron molle TaxID=49168 RepID=A0ACC0M2Q2_RHOML|nr:hypothetical protein RHMOL_Rhmol10G0151000 [Rhododendron molle]